jgi:hypothetical protein
MIPICEQTLDVKAGSGTVSLKYLTDRDRQVRYLKITRQEQTDRERHKAAARTNLGDQATESEITLEAYRLQVAERESSPEVAIDLIDSYIDLFVVGWDFSVPFPDNGRPSAMFPIYAKFELYSLIRDNLDELTGLTVDEGKN